MAGVARWFKSGGAVLTKFRPLRSRDDERDDDHDMGTERSSERTKDGKKTSIGRCIYYSGGYFLVKYYYYIMEGVNEGR